MENNWFLYASLAGLLIGINTVMNNYFMNKNINPYVMLILKNIAGMKKKIKKNLCGRITILDS